jgi:transposase
MQEKTMCLKPHAIGPIPEETVRVARALLPKGNIYMKMRDELGTLYEDTQFADLFPSLGQPAEAPWRLGLMSILQFAEGLSDRQAAEAVRTRIDWRYALGLGLNEEGIDYSVLCEFRTRLIAGKAEQQLLDTLLTRLKVRGLLKLRSRQRTDSTHVLAAVRMLNRLECVGESMRRALDALSVLAPEWLANLAPPAWFERYARPFVEFRLPDGRGERYALAEQIGADGFQLLAAVKEAGMPSWPREVPALVVLGQVWEQQFSVSEGVVRWRSAEELPPASELITSPYDAEARFSKKRSTEWMGYVAHVSETCEPDTPNVLTNVETTQATLNDSPVVSQVHTHLAERDLLPGEHLVDTGYMSAENLLTSRKEHGVNLIGPLPPEGSWQAQAGQGFDAASFALDWETQQATCPAGHTSRSWVSGEDRHGHAVVTIGFSSKDCRACPLRTQCTRSKTRPRSLCVRAEAGHEALQEGRKRQSTQAFKAAYKARAGIEGTISQAVRIGDLRRSRYVGLAKTHLHHLLMATAINWVRVGAWLLDKPREHTRTSRFAKLAQGVT